MTCEMLSYLLQRFVLRFERRYAIESLEDRLVIKPVPTRRPFTLPQQPHRRIVVDGLPTDAGIVDHLPDAIKLGRYGSAIR